MAAPKPTQFVQGQGSVTADNLGTFQQTCATVAQLRGFIGLTGYQAYLQGYVSMGDGGQGVFGWSPAATGPDNGTTIVQPTGVAVGAWVRLSLEETAQGQAQFLNDIAAPPFNAVPGGVVNAIIAQALSLTSAGGFPTLIPIGEWFCSATISTRGPVTLYGQGRGAGPGAVTNSNCSQLVAANPAMDILDIGPSAFGSDISGLQFNSSVGGKSAGNAIYLNGAGSGSVCSNYTLTDLAFNNQFCDIFLNVCGAGYISNTYHQSWTNIAVQTNGDGVSEGATGFVNNNYFFGNTAVGNGQAACFYTRNGYFKFSENLTLGAQVGVFLNVGQFPAGAPEIRGNWFEEQDIASVYVSNNTGTQKASMLKVVDNEFSVAALGAAARINFQGHILIQPGASANWIDTVEITGNVFRTTVALTSASFIFVAAGQSVNIAGNVLNGLTGNTTSGIVVTGSQPTTVQILDNIIKGAFNVRYQLTANCLLRDYGSGLTAAEVNAITCADGSSVWVSDGNPALQAVTGSSTGCFAVHQSGAWVVDTTLTAAVTGYGTPTGGSHQASFAAGAITLPNLAAAVAQLIVDLKTKGLLAT